MKTGLLLSGGMDSLSIAWWKRPEWAVTIDYGQKAAVAERVASEQVCKALGIQHEFIKVDCSSLGSGDMANGVQDAHAATSDWWPYRNQLLVTLAGMRAITQDVNVLYVGTVKSDGESHADGTPGFVRLIDQLMSIQEGELHIVAPAIEYSTADLVRHAQVPPILLAWAHSCHKSDFPCGSCRGCYKYLATYHELGGEYFCGS